MDAERKVSGQVAGGPWTKSSIPEVSSVFLIYFPVLQKTDIENPLSPIPRRFAQKFVRYS